MTNKHTMRMHSSVTIERVLEAAQRQMWSLDSPGLCLACGCENEGCEPDARRYQCEACGERQVYGAEELVIMLG